MQVRLLLLLLLHPLRLVASQQLHADPHVEMEEFLERRRVNGDIARTFVLTLVATVLTVAILTALILLWRAHRHTPFLLPPTTTWTYSPAPSNSTLIWTLSPPPTSTPLVSLPPTSTTTTPPSLSDLARSRLSRLHVRLLRLRNSTSSAVSATWNGVTSTGTAISSFVSAKWNDLNDIQREARLTLSNLRLLQRLKQIILRKVVTPPPPTRVIPT